MSGRIDRLLLLPAVLLFACNDGGTTSETGGNSATGTGTTGTSGATTQEPLPTSTPTTGNDEGGATDSATGTSTGNPVTATATDATTTSTTATSTGPEDTTTTTTEPGTTSTGPDETTTGTTGTTGNTTTGDDSSTGADACACPDIEVPLDDGIFLLSDEAVLWKYFPETNDFQMLGAVDCGGLFGTFSMAVDRLGFAWVQYAIDGALRKVDLTDVSKCTDPGYVPGQQGVDNFGMAFVSNSQSDACDRIYGNTYSGLGGYTEGVNIGDFISIDPDSLKVAKLGKTNFDGAEVTGTGDGRAFVFGGANPSKLVEMDKVLGTAIATTPLTGLEINDGAFAFAFFAGDFYFFTDSDNDLFASEVTHMDYDDSDNNGKQDLTVLTMDAPLLIVGAGVSTCAPTVPM